jgi:hypothetical protein
VNESDSGIPAAIFDIPNSPDESLYVLQCDVQCSGAAILIPDGRVRRRKNVIIK